MVTSITSINNQETNEVPSDFSKYKVFITACKALEKAFEENDPSDPKDLRRFVQSAGEVEKFGASLTKELADKNYEIFNDMYPMRADIIRVPPRMQFSALDRIPFDELLPPEKEKYIELLVRVHHVHFDEFKWPYYYVGFPRFMFEIPEDKKLLNEIATDKSRVLTEEELRIVSQGNEERDRYKIHLNVPPEKKLEVLRRILEVQLADDKIEDNIFREKEAAGLGSGVNRKEKKEHGCRLPTLNQYKMSEVGYTSDLAADFVFYPLPASGQTPQEALVDLTRELVVVLAELDLPEAERVPRFSTPVIINGENVPGMTFVHGNGNFKEYLRERHGKDVLDEYYDPDTNWALRKGEKIDFGMLSY